MEIEAGTRVGKYEIQSLVGEGGMGRVYRALDTDLGRPVALKFLPAEVAADPRRTSRFEQEARAVSALNHPNILTVYEIGRDGSSRFFATEFVGGVTLREHAAARPLGLGEVLGGAPKKVLTNVQSVVAPSPGGRHFAFLRYPPALSEVWVANADGTGERRLWSCNDPDWVAGVAWSPDAKLVTTAYGTEEGGQHMTPAAAVVIDWTPDGRLFFTSNVGGGARIWVVGADGTGAKAPTELGEASGYKPLVSPDGRHVFFASLRSKTNQVWRVDVDGGNPRRLTEGDGVSTFSLTPDGRRVVYATYSPGIWKVSAEGGPPTKAADAQVGGGVWVSPDGGLFAYSDLDQQTGRWRVVVLKLDDGAQLKTIDLSLTAGAWRWSSDSRAFVYADTQGGVANLWRLPLDGGPAKQITNFGSDEIFWFAYSRDGRTLALSRGSTTRDAVSISDEAR